MKLLGCLILLLCCTSLGFLKAESYQTRRKELADIGEIIKLLNMEISYKQDPLPRTFLRIAELHPCWFAKVLQCCSRELMNQESMQNAWEKALNENSGNCPLVREDLTILEDLSAGLGRSGVAGQEKLFLAAAARLEDNLAGAREQERSKGRMYRSLGISAGIIAVILLL